MKYAIVIEKSDNGFGAYVPDLPGCVAAADTEREVRILIQEAVELHLESLRESGQHVPPPSHAVGYVEVLTPAWPSLSAASIETSAALAPARGIHELPQGSRRGRDRCRRPERRAATPGRLPAAT
jgi:predicted RNase H-like HicB family nuclease